jgi:four helix bundle protein
MRRAALSVCSNIAEGCGRRGDDEFRRFLDVAMGSACELESALILAADLEFIKAPRQSELMAELIDVKRMLAGLIRTLRPKCVRKAARLATPERIG